MAIGLKPSWETAAGGEVTDGSGVGTIVVVTSVTVITTSGTFVGLDSEDSVARAAAFVGAGVCISVSEISVACSKSRSAGVDFTSSDAHAVKIRSKIDKLIALLALVLFIDALK